ncbi:MAG: ClbS/DfsB family four-helix bundle protein [Chloroflexi bacterium]|nr:ClbS/DfsB family four-helix bundle protein [Chloroflexota bacterium]
MSKAELLTDLETEFQNLLNAVEGLTDEQMVEPWYGEWGVREILGHVIGWHHEMDGVLQRISRGEKPVLEGVTYDDTDAWNARFAETWQAASPAAVLEELIASKGSFVKAAQMVPEERFEEGRAAHRILLGSGPDHYREHTPRILEWRKKAGK